jgi:metal-responsive CopG/Arc/MetJ family transcriptional regulator
MVLHLSLVMQCEVAYKRIGISLPTSLINRADEARQDVPRSKFIQRCIKKDLDLREKVMI